MRSALPVRDTSAKSVGEEPPQCDSSTPSPSEGLDTATGVLDDRGVDYVVARERSREGGGRGVSPSRSRWSGSPSRRRSPPSRRRRPPSRRPSASAWSGRFRPSRSARRRCWWSTPPPSFWRVRSRSGTSATGRPTGRRVRSDKTSDDGHDGARGHRPRPSRVLRGPPVAVVEHVWVENPANGADRDTLEREEYGEPTLRSVQVEFTGLGLLAGRAGWTSS